MEKLCQSMIARLEDWSTTWLDAVGWVIRALPAVTLPPVGTCAEARTGASAAATAKPSALCFPPNLSPTTGKRPPVPLVLPAV